MWHYLHISKRNRPAKHIYIHVFIRFICTAFNLLARNIHFYDGFLYCSQLTSLSRQTNIQLSQNAILFLHVVHDWFHVLSSGILHHFTILARRSHRWRLLNNESYVLYRCNLTHNLHQLDQSQISKIRQK